MTKVNKDPDTTTTTAGGAVGRKKRERDSRTRGVRKPYAKRACVPCKKAHAGCDNNRPCRRCVAQGIEHMCVDAERRRSTTPRKPRKSSRRSSTSSSGVAVVSDSPSEISAEDQHQQKSKRRKSTNSIDIGVDDKSGISGSSSIGSSSRRSSGSTPSLLNMVDDRIGTFGNGDNVAAAGTTTGAGDDVGHNMFTENDLLDMMPGFDALLMPQPSNTTNAAIGNAIVPELEGPSITNDTSLSSFDTPAVSLGNMEDISSFVSQGDQQSGGSVAKHHPYSSTTSLTVPSEIEKFRNTFTVNMLPYLIKGLADTANTTTDPHRLQQVQQQQQQLLQFLPSIRNITAEQREVLKRQLQNDIANFSYANSQVASMGDYSGHHQPFGIGSDLANQHGSTQTQALMDLTDTDALDNLLSAANLLPQIPTSLSDNVGQDMEMDLLDTHTSSDTQPHKDGDDPFADLSSIWSPYTSFTPSQQQQQTIPFNNSLQTMGLYGADDKPSSPLTPSSLLNPEIFDKQRDTSTASGSSSAAIIGHDKETNAQIQNLLSQLIVLSTKDSPQPGDQTSVALSGTAGDDDKYFISEPRSPEYKSTVTFTDLDNTDDSTGSTIVDLVTQSASELQDEVVTDKDILRMLEEDNWLQQQQQQHRDSKSKDKQNVSSYWVNHEGDDDEYRVEMGDGGNKNINHHNALVNYTGNSGKSGTNTAISGDMRMRALDQLSGVQAIRQLLSKKKLSVKDIVRQLLIQNRDMHMLKLAQEEDRKKIEGQREEINSLRKKQDDMMSIILDLQKLMISSGFNVNKM